MLVYYYKNKKSKLYFGDRIVVLHDFLYQTGGSNILGKSTFNIFTAYFNILENWIQHFDKPNSTFQNH
jgi:hypothetical protein